MDEGKVTVAKSEKRQKTRIIALRLTPDERSRLLVASALLRVSLSKFIRDAAIDRAHGRALVLRNVDLDL